MTKAVNVRTFKGEGDAPKDALNIKVFGGSGDGGEGGSGGIRALKIENEDGNYILNASYNDLVGMAEAGELAVIFDDSNVPYILSYLTQGGETAEETTYNANFKCLDGASYTFLSYDANQPMMGV